MARQRRTKDKEYMAKINSQTEQEYKEELSRDMKTDSKYRSCGCSICDEAHKLFQNDPDKFLEQRWQDYLEQINRKPCTDEEIDKTFAEYGLVIDRQTGRVNKIEEIIELSRSVEGVEVTGQTKEERIKTMKNIFNSY